MITAEAETATATATDEKPKASQKAGVGQKRAHGAPVEGQGGQEGQGLEESDQGLEKGWCCPRRQQGRDDSRFVEDGPTELPWPN